METKIDIEIDKEGKIRAWWSKEFEELISDIATEPVENREEGPRLIKGFPFHPEFCG